MTQPDADTCEHLLAQEFEALREKCVASCFQGYNYATDGTDKQECPMCLGLGYVPRVTWEGLWGALNELGYYVTVDWFGHKGTAGATIISLKENGTSTRGTALDPFEAFKTTAVKALGLEEADPDEGLELRPEVVEELRQPVDRDSLLTSDEMAAKLEAKDE